jgi:hypothetical protein
MLEQPQRHNEEDFICRAPATSTLASGPVARRIKSVELNRSPLWRLL